MTNDREEAKHEESWCEVWRQAAADQGLDQDTDDPKPSPILGAR